MATKKATATCEHNWAKDRSPFGGADTGDDVCTKCGAERYRYAKPRKEDAVQAARRVVDEAIGERPKTRPSPKK